MVGPSWGGGVNDVVQSELEPRTENHPLGEQGFLGITKKPSQKRLLQATEIIRFVVDLRMRDQNCTADFDFARMNGIV